MSNSKGANATGIEFKKLSLLKETEPSVQLLSFFFGNKEKYVGEANVINPIKKCNNSWKIVPINTYIKYSKLSIFFKINPIIKKTIVNKI